MNVDPGHWQMSMGVASGTQLPLLQTRRKKSPQASPGPLQLRHTGEAHDWPCGFRVHARLVAVGMPATQPPAAVQLLLVMVPLSVPVNAQKVEPEQVPLQVVVLPHGMPLGLKVHAREVPALPVTLQAPAALHVLELMVPASVPLVVQVPPVELCPHMPVHTVFEPQGVPLGLKVQARDVGIEPDTRHWPLALQVLLLMVPASVPVVEQPPPVWTQVPDHTVFEPQPVPAGLKVQACDVAMPVPTTQAPVALHVLGVVVPAWEPMVLQPLPTWVQFPNVVEVPQSRETGL